MKIITSAALLLCTTNALAIVVTNGPTANTTAPANPLVGWQYIGSAYPDGRGVGPTAIGPRLFVTATHINWGSSRVWFHGQFYSVERVIRVPGTDMTFLGMMDRLPTYATVYMGATPNQSLATVIGNGGYLIGDGSPALYPNDGIHYYWGVDDGRRRWLYSSEVSVRNSFGPYSLPTRRTVTFLFDRGGVAGGDSGGAAFLSTGEFLCNITWGGNPVTVGERVAVGELVGPWLKLIPELQPYLVKRLTDKAVPILQ